MDLAGSVVIYDGEIHPVDAVEITKDVNTDTYTDRFNSQGYTAVTGTEITGSMRSYRSYELPHLGAPPVDDLYIFPEEGGTAERIIVSDAIVTGTEDNISTQTIEFVARGIEE